MSILAIDPATSCGWAMLGDDDRVTYGHWDLSLDKGQHRGMRYAFLRRHLAKLETVEAIAYERSMHLKGDAIMVHGGLVAAIEDWAATRTPQVPVVHIGASSLKKHTTGKGRAEKHEIAAVVTRRFRIEAPITCFDETDALAILGWYLDEHMPALARKWPAIQRSETAATQMGSRPRRAPATRSAVILPAPQTRAVDLMQSLQEALSQFTKGPTP